MVLIYDLSESFIFESYQPDSTAPPVLCVGFFMMSCTTLTLGICSPASSVEALGALPFVRLIDISVSSHASIIVKARQCATMQVIP